MDRSSRFRLPGKSCPLHACADDFAHSHRLNHRHRLSVAVYAAGVVILAFAWFPVEVAAAHQSDKVNPQARILRPLVQKCIKNPETYSAEKARFDEYFQTYFFPSMTQTEPELLGLLGERRKELVQRYLWASDNSQLQSDLTKMSFDFAKKVAGNRNYHPAVRLNATLLLGSLDAKYSDNVNNPPTPYLAATQTLLKIVELAADNDPRVTPPMLAAALIGLERQAQFCEDLSPQVKNEFKQTLLRIVNQPELSKEMDSDVQFWLKRVAASALAELSKTSSDNQIVTDLISLISAPDMPLEDRCQVAVMLTKIPLEGKQVNTDAVAKGLVLLTDTVANKEAEKAVEFEDMRLGKGPGRASLPGLAMRGSRELEFDRRRLLSQLENLNTALGVIKPLTSEKIQAAVDDVLIAIQPVQEAAKDKEVADLTLTELIRQMAADVNLAAELGLSEEQDPVTSESQDDLELEDEPAK